MAVAAAVNCLRGFDRSGVDALFFASTSYPFREKQGAALLARALDLRRDVRSADLGGSLARRPRRARAPRPTPWPPAPRAACCVVASDCRMGAPGSGLERSGGDGAAAFLVGAADAIATLEAFHGVTDELVDLWRAEGDRFVHSWEERFVLQEGYQPRIARGREGPARAHRHGARKTSRASPSTRPTSAPTPASRARCAWARRASWRRCSDGSATPAAPSRRCCSRRLSSRRSPASASSWRLRRRRRGLRAPGRRSPSRSSSRGAASPGTSRAAAR